MPEMDLSTVTVGEWLRQWPETVRVFLDYKMNCPACPIAPFMTIDEAASEYGINADALKLDLRLMANRDERDAGRQRNSEVAGSGRSRNF